MNTFIKYSLLLVAPLIMNGCSKPTYNQSSNRTEGEISASTSSPTPVVADSKKENTEPKAKVSNKEIKWLSMDDALKLNAKNPKKIFVDVYTDWCGWCRRMDKTTLKDPIIANYISENYYPVKLNAESNKEVIYKGQTMTESELATKVFGATGFPTTVYLDNNQNLIQPVPGYLDVDMLNKILHYYGEDHYKTTSWDKYQTSF